MEEIAVQLSLHGRIEIVRTREEVLIAATEILEDDYGEPCPSRALNTIQFNRMLRCAPRIPPIVAWVLERSVLPNKSAVDESTCHHRTGLVVAGVEQLQHLVDIIP